jgi:hypothetical protein
LQFARIEVNGIAAAAVITLAIGLIRPALRIV